MSENREPIFIPCECGSEGIVIEHDEHETYLSIWGYGLSRTNSWRYRWRAIWRILRRGTPYGDCIVLKESGCRALSNAVLKQGGTENERLRREYYELIMAVSKKYPGETRHQTALRYIVEAESRCSGSQKDLTE